MNRRQALGAMAAGLASLIPSWHLLQQKRRHFNLQDFCAKTARRYDMTKPFVQGSHVYATDGMVCIRAGSHGGDMLGPEFKLPPASTLPWGGRGDKVTKTRVVTVMEWCGRCDGSGLENRRPCTARGCDEWHSRCKVCDDSQVVGDGPCKACGGRAEYMQPCIVEATAGSEVQYFDRELWDKVQGIGDVQVRLRAGKDDCGASFLAFDGGDGLLMPMDADAVKFRMQA